MSVFAWEEGFDAPGVLKNNFNINKRVETIKTRFKTFSNKVAMETYIIQSAVEDLKRLLLQMASLRVSSLLISMMS